MSALFGRDATLSKKLAFSFFISFIYIQYKSLRFAHFIKVLYVLGIRLHRTYIITSSYEPATLSPYIVVEVAKHTHVRFSYWKTGSYIIFCSMIQFTVLENTDTFVHGKSINQTFFFALLSFLFLSQVYAQKSWGSYSNP